MDQIEARAALPITEAMDKALARSNISDHSKKSYRSSAKLFAAFFGDVAVRDVTDDMALSFREKMLDVPAGYSHDARFRGLSFPAMIDAADELDDEFETDLTERRKQGELTEAEYESALEKGRIARMTKKTACKHLSAMNSIWTKFINAGATPSRKRINPFGGLIFSVAERDKDRRVKREFEGEDLVKIFSSRPFREEMARAPEERSREFWITTCVAFTGARREEIAQLRLEDVNLKTRIPHFSFKEGKGQSLKTERATRDVPIHPFLMHLGIEAYVERRAATGSVWLFPGAGDINVGHRSKTSAEWFGRIIHDLGLYEEGGCLHRLRKSLATQLADSHVNTAYIKDILGHERECVTERHYIGGATLEKKAELLKMVTFGLKPAEACRLIPAASIEAGEGNVLHLTR
ncbi:MAG: tyrosine-type recombinase/integrase [Marivibrio sp.]|uniref:tyrosine-type recombinase/integrase n=1 Tax=Marivibrio sp. TaxID=2039719 RepID=UPI0032EED90B